MSHLYGDTLYYATSLYDHYVHGRSYCRPEAYYFWIYYFLMNFIWIVIPFYYLSQSVKTISNAINALQRMSAEEKAR